MVNINGMNVACLVNDFTQSPIKHTTIDLRQWFFQTGLTSSAPNPQFIIEK